jgi:TatA/E family protein of Tat protein translocase
MVIFLIGLLVFGPNRLPEIGRQVGRGVRELRKLQRSLKSDLDEVLADGVSDDAEPAPQLPPLATPAPAAESGDVVSTPDVTDVNPPPPPAPPDPT